MTLKYGRQLAKSPKCGHVILKHISLNREIVGVTRSQYLNGTMSLITKALSTQRPVGGHTKVSSHVDFLTRQSFWNPNMLDLKCQRGVSGYTTHSIFVSCLSHMHLPHHRQCLLLVIVVAFACALALCNRLISSSLTAFQRFHGSDSMWTRPGSEQN